eukprot:440798-Hanusia_phi.AAC.8
MGRGRRRREEDEGGGGGRRRREEGGKRSGHGGKQRFKISIGERDAGVEAEDEGGERAAASASTVLTP